VHVGEGSGRVAGVPPMPVLSLCSRLVIMLGTGISYRAGFMSVAEVIVVTGSGSGGSCGTNCGELHPPIRKAGPRLVDFIGGCGGPSPRVCCCSPTNWSGEVDESGIRASLGAGSGSTSGGYMSMSTG